MDDIEQRRGWLRQIAELYKVDAEEIGNMLLLEDAGELDDAISSLWTRFRPKRNKLRIEVYLTDDEIGLLKKLAIRRSPKSDPHGKRWRGILKQLADTMIKRRLRQCEKEFMPDASAKQC